MKRAFLPWVLVSWAAAGGEGVDVDVAQRVATALPTGEVKVVDFLERLGASRTDEDRPIGFGARRLRLALRGEKTTTFLTVIAWNDRVGQVEVRCDVEDRETRERVARAYEGKEPALDEQGVSVLVGKLADPPGFFDERRKVLGDPLKLEPAPEIATEYLLLWSPRSDLVYGRMYGDDGAPPPGREALEKILAREQAPAILEDLLRGPNPEGRAYAAEGLLRLERRGGKLSEQARKNIDWVRRSEVNLQVCRGCVVTSEPAAEPLKEMLSQVE
jgi:hypothetical protein